MTKSRRGFTLIELSIVLVIIGLIAGGVLVGRDLIHQAQLKKVVTDLEGFETATYAFKNKYNCYPGDCKNAHMFFGAECGVNNTGGWNSCNGNGNNKILGAPEWLKFWEHLSTHAEMIEGGYIATGGYVSVPGTSHPAAPLPNSQYEVRHNISPPWAGINLERGIVVLLNAVGSWVGGGGNITIMTAADAYGIDKKIDDGVPLQGKVVNGGSGCLAGGNGAYILTSTSNGCVLYFTIVK